MTIERKMLMITLIVALLAISASLIVAAAFLRYLGNG
jgi:hypothetical protein